MTILPNKKLLTTLHEHFVRGVLFGLGKDIMHFDNAQPWVHYYLLHALQILGVELEKDIAEKMVQALKHCAN